MSQSIAIGSHRSSHQESARHHRIAMGAVMGLIIGAMTSAIVLTAVNFVSNARSAETTAVETVKAVKVYPVGELPREWRGGRKSVQLEPMSARSQQRSPGLDWIREGAKRTRDGYSIDTSRGLGEP